MRKKKTIYSSIISITLAIILSIMLIFHCTDDAYRSNNVFTIIPADSVDGITFNEAEKLCYEKIGTVSSENGFDLIYIPHVAGEYQGKQYYIFVWEWLVENHHYSVIGYTAVLSDGSEIREAIECYNGDFICGDVMWKA